MKRLEIVLIMFCARKVSSISPTVLTSDENWGKDRRKTWRDQSTHFSRLVAALKGLEKEGSIENSLTSKMIFLDDFACRPKTKHCNTNFKNLGPDLPTHFPSLLISISKCFEKWQTERKRRRWNGSVRKKMPNSGNGRMQTNKTWCSISCIRKRWPGDAETWCTQGVHAFNVKLKVMSHYYKSLFHRKPKSFVQGRWKV